MQRNIKLLFAATILLFTWSTHAAAGIWRDVTPAQPGARAVAKVRLFEADDPALRAALADTPHESSGRRDHHLQIPMPDGSLQLFSVQESPIMAPSLAARYPDIKTFRVIGVDDESYSGRIDITPLGFHAMIGTPDGRVFVDPDDFRLQNHVYRSRYSASEPRRAYNCGVASHSRVDPLGTAAAPARRIAARVSGNLLQYDLAVAVTFEYHQFFGGDVGLTMSAIATTLVRVNEIYERDLGIRLMLVAGNDQLYETVDNGVLDNEDEFALLDQVDNWIDNRLPGGDSAYDIGHMFSRPSFLGGGVARIGAVCDNAIKAAGVSGLSTPSGDAFDVDLVAHEIGHQFDAEHTFNGTEGACGNGRVASSAYEPGSGSSIMAYSGICNSEDLQSNSDAAFHAGSIAQIDAFTAGNGGACALLVPTANGDPVITAIADTTIPANTPFLLGDPAGPPAATDPDLDTLEYRWDQMDAGCPTDDASFGTDNGSNALFRSYAPRPDAWRNFPALGTQVQGRYDKAEVLPCHSRALDFRLTATDGNSGQDFEDVRVNVDDTAGPFEITNLDPDPGIVSGTPFPVVWDPAGTDAAPISCVNVDIDLLAFNPTYSRYTVYSLGTATNSSGSAMVTVTPDTASHPRARVRVKCSDNIFYDISDTDLNITAGMGPGVPLNDSVTVAQVFADPAITDITAPACPAVVDCSPPPTGNTGTRNGDASAFGFYWVVFLAGLAILRRLWRPQG